MKLDGRRQSVNVEDRRGRSTVKTAGDPGQGDTFSVSYDEL